MDIYNLLTKLCRCEGVSGDEESFSLYVEEMLKPYCEKVWTDKIGNVFGHIPSKNKNAEKIMIEAHLDRIGLMVKNIDKDGFLEVETVGGINKKILSSKEVMVLGREKSFYGIIGAKSPHLITNSDKDKEEKLFVDIGLSKKEASKYIETGDMISLINNPEKLLNNCISSVCLDNRAGMAAIFNYLDEFKNKDFLYDVYIVFSVMEETGLLGAAAAAFSVEPDISVVIDVTYGKMSEGDKTAGTFSLGSGAVIFRGPDTSDDITLSLIDCAKEHNIPFDIEVSGSGSGTNAFVIQNSKKATKSLLMSVPLKYMHQTVEVVSEDDIKAVGSLLYHICRGGAKLD